MITYTKEEHITDREVFLCKITLGDEVLLESEVDTNDETLEEHRLWLHKLQVALGEN